MFNITINEVKENPINIENNNEKIIIAHICNENTWENEFTKTLSKKWIEPEIIFKKEKLTIGKVQIININNNITIANMIVENSSNNIEVEYGAFRLCLNYVNDKAFRTNSTIHIPLSKKYTTTNIKNNILNIIKNVMSVNITLYNPILT